MNTRRIEPGLLNIFRLMASLQAIGFWLSLSFAEILPERPGMEFQSRNYLNLAGSFLLFGYLIWPWLHSRLKRTYLPIGLSLAVMIPLLNDFFNLQFESGRDPFTLMNVIWQTTPLLLVPLVLIAWQYDFESVVWFCFGTAIFDLAIFAIYIGAFDSQILSFLFAIFMRTASFLVVGYLVTQLLKTQRQQRKALSQANQQLSRHARTLEDLATSHERNRLARELHDTLAHTLSGLAVQLEAINTVLDPAQQEVHTMLKKAQETTRNGLSETRRALKDLRAQSLDDLGLGLALTNLAQATGARSDIPVLTDIPVTIGNLPPGVEQMIYRITQESLENITRHADARHARVRLTCSESILRLTIADDGSGFDITELESDENLGILGMKERAAAYGGTLEVSSSPSHGTTIQLTLEIPHD
jgi:signal transduction histidine kinase